MTSLAHFLPAPAALELGAFAIGPAQVRTVLRLDAGGRAVVHAFHHDPEGRWHECADAAAIVQACSEDEMLAAADEIRFPSGLPVVINRFDELARVAAPWLAQLS